MDCLQYETPTPTYDKNLITKLKNKLLRTMKADAPRLSLEPEVSLSCGNTPKFLF